MYHSQLKFISETVVISERIFLESIQLNICLVSVFSRWNQDNSIKFLWLNICVMNHNKKWYYLICIIRHPKNRYLDIPMAERFSKLCYHIPNDKIGKFHTKTRTRERDWLRKSIKRMQVFKTKENKEIKPMEDANTARFRQSPCVNQRKLILEISLLSFIESFLP